MALMVRLSKIKVVRSYGAFMYSRKRRLVMRRIKHVIATILFCTGLLVSGFQKNDAAVCAAKINTNTASDFNENKLKTGALEMQEVILDASGKIVSYYIDEDGINQKAVYDEKKDKWTSNTVKDTAMKNSLSRDMTAIDLLVSSEKEFYVLASKGNYDEEATDFLQYKIG